MPVDPLRLKLLLPAMKASLLMLWVVATKPPTSTLAPGAKYTPDGLVKKTWPLALMRPKIWLGSLLKTRLSVTLLALGCTKFTCAALPTSNRVQSTTARWLLWVMVMLALLVPTVLAMLAVPPTTLPPVGNWVEAGVAACAKPATDSAATSGVRWNRFMARADS